MNPPVICRHRTPSSHLREHGITMVLVAISLVAIIAIAALSIDVITLYLARSEAQRSADAAALAAARVISISGITGTADPNNETTSWQSICGSSATATAFLTAQAVAQANAIAGLAPTVGVNYSIAGASGSGSVSADCSVL